LAIVAGLIGGVVVGKVFASELQFSPPEARVIIAAALTILAVTDRRYSQSTEIRIAWNADKDYSSYVDFLRFIPGLSSSWRSNTSKKNPTAVEPAARRSKQD
jgi:hypothetical protein